MRNWNVIVTVAPGPGRESRLLRQLRHLGYFERTEFKYVCLGRSTEKSTYNETITAVKHHRLNKLDKHKPWCNMNIGLGHASHS